MAARPRLLFLAQCLPYPPQAGVAVRTYNVLKQLQPAYDIDLVAFYRVNHHRGRRALDAAREQLLRVAESVAEPAAIPSEHLLLRKLWDHTRSVLSRRVYTYYEYDSPAFARRVRAVLRTRRPDLVHLDSLDLHGWLGELPRLPIACTHHDIDAELLRLRSQRVDNALVRAYLRFQATLSERTARQLCPGLALNVMMSERDADRLRAVAPGTTTVVVPNGTDTDYFQPNGVKPVGGRVVFVGPTYSFPNKDAVEFLLGEVWPRIRATSPAASLHLIGRHASPDRARYAAETGVTPVGYVADVRPALAEASCCVVPIRVGGGTRLKVLDAWAMGKAVVSTSIGCEGLEAVDGQNILIRDTPAAFAAAVHDVLTNRTLRAHLEHHARRTATTTYDWRAIGHRLRTAYGTLLD